jgi:Flp pilus assembly pilin Flp
MRLFLRKNDPNRIEFGLIYGVIALILLGVARWPPILSVAPDCVFKGLTGVPCPTCGSTRSLVHLSHGDILKALSMDPLVTIALIGAVLYFVISLLTVAFDLPRITCLLTDKERDIARVTVVLLLVAQWAYLTARF